MPNMFSERKRLSVGRTGFDRLLRRMKQLVGDDIDGLRVYHRARALVGQVDQAYEVAARAVKMLDQMTDGSWPLSEMPGVQRAAERAHALVSWVNLDQHPIKAGVSSLQGLVKSGHAEKDDEDTLIDASSYVDSVVRSTELFEELEHDFEKCQFNSLTVSGQRSFVQTIRTKFKEIEKCLI